jgi:hypothetical protein
MQCRKCVNCPRWLLVFVQLDSTNKTGTLANVTKVRAVWLMAYDGLG